MKEKYRYIGETDKTLKERVSEHIGLSVTKKKMSHRHWKFYMVTVYEQGKFFFYI